MSIQCKQIRSMPRGETHSIDIDWGENTAGEETGVLKDGDTVASCAVVVDSKPTGASDPTLGTPDVNDEDDYINGRLCSAGEATSTSIATASNQAYGTYRLKFTATTTNGFVLPRFVKVEVKQP